MSKAVKRSRAGSSIAAFALFAFFVVLVAGIAALVAFTLFDKPTDALPPDGLTFTVEPGEPGGSVARRLEEARAIRSRAFFLVIMKARGLDGELKNGTYRIERDMCASEVLGLIVSGKQALERLTVPEGASLGTIAGYAEAAGVAGAAEVLAAAVDPAFIRGLGLSVPSLDGYLYPDTYLVPRDAGAEELLTLMVATFRARLAEAVPESAALSEAEVHDRVILASIIEREYRRPEEAPLMASVFWNRLRIGMALQSCATVVYVITERQGKPHPTRLFDRDISIQDPFNTYVNPGLPPAPICAPGLTALLAAFRPATTDFLYFRLVDEASGEHHFSKSLDEHIKAASLYVKPRTK